MAMILAANRVVSGDMSIGDFVLINALMMQIFVPLNFLGFVYREMKGSMANIDAMFNLLKITPAPLADDSFTPRFMSIWATMMVLGLDVYAESLGRPLTEEEVEPVNWAQAQFASRMTAVDYANALAAVTAPPTTSPAPPSTAARSRPTAGASSRAETSRISVGAGAIPTIVESTPPRG